MTLDDPDAPRRRISDRIPDKPQITNTGANLAKDIQRTLRVLIVLTVVLYVVLGLFMAWSWILSARNTSALCTLRHDAEERVHSGQVFLEQNPHGIPGVPRETLQASIKNSQSTVKALESLNCSSPIVSAP